MKTSVGQISFYIVSWDYLAGLWKKKKKIRGTCCCHEFKGMILELQQEKTHMNISTSLNF